MITLRPYQEAAKAAVYEHLRTRDDNPCVVIPTAGGKTPIMASICKDAVGPWNGRVLILAHVKELLEQATEKLNVICPEVKFGVYSAGLKRRDTEHSVIIAGIQSVYKRACELDAFDLIIIDEAHMIPPDGEGMYQQFLADAKVINPAGADHRPDGHAVPLEVRHDLRPGEHPQPRLLRGRREGTDPRRLSVPADHQGGHAEGRHQRSARPCRRVRRRRGRGLDGPGRAGGRRLRRDRRPDARPPVMFDLRLGREAWAAHRQGDCRR